MHERLLLDNHSKPVRDASNILYEEVKKHGANRHLIYIFDDDYRTAAQERDFEWTAWPSHKQIIKNPRQSQNISGDNKPIKVENSVRSQSLKMLISLMQVILLLVQWLN